MKPKLTRRLIGGSAAIFGLWWTCALIFPLVNKLWFQEIETSDTFFVLSVIPLMAILGLLALYFGVRLFREMDEPSLKGIVGVLALGLNVK